MLGMHQKMNKPLQLFHHEYLITIIKQNFILEYQLKLHDEMFKGFKASVGWKHVFFYSRQTAVALTEFASLYYKKLLHKEAVKGL